MVIDGNRYTTTLITEILSAIGIKNMLGIADAAKAADSGQHSSATG